MQLKPCASISNECQVQRVVWLGRVLVARGGGCPVQDGPEGGGGNIETTGIGGCCPFTLLQEQL